jgi:hypothetical protein
MTFFSEYQFDLLYRPGKQMPVSDALSLNPPIEEDILDLLPPKKGDAEPSMEFQIPTKTHHGKYQQVLFTLHFKVRAKTKGIKFP